MVDYRRDATVRVVFGELRSPMLALVELEEDGLIGQAKLFEDESDLPTIERVAVSILSVLIRIAIRTIRSDRPCGSRE